MDILDAVKTTINLSSISIRRSHNVDEAYKDLKEIRKDISHRIEFVETLDLKMTVVGYTIFEKQHDFLKKMDKVKRSKNEIMEKTDLTPSELSLELEPFDRQIFDLEVEHSDKIFKLSEEKITLQQQMEDAMSLLDTNLEDLKATLQMFVEALDYQKHQVSKSEANLLREKYSPVFSQFQDFVYYCDKKQLEGWKVQNSETMLADVLEQKGLKMTKSGLLITESGHSITYSMAREHGYFDDIELSTSKLFDHLKERDEVKVEPPPSPQSETISETVTRGSSDSSGMSSEDVKYLKRVVGKPLTLALAEITAKHPKDPIHYLGHYLFKYRYNQDMEEIRKREIDELENERKIIAERRWHQFVEEEARNAVLEMVLRAEQIAYENELKRIEAEMAAMAEEEEQEANYADEARDKFDESALPPRTT